MDPDNNPEPLAFPSENWIPKPRIVSASQTTNGFALSVPAVPGYDYTVEFKDSLSTSNSWTPLSAVRSPTGSVTTVSATVTNVGDMGFYRLNRQPER